MKTRALVKLSLPVLLAGGTAAAAPAPDAAVDMKAAVAVAAKASRALGKHDAARAVPLAERAVALAPRDAGHRALLGRIYLEAGRFASARATLEEAMVLDPRDGRAALGLVLAQIATGDRATARRTLDAHAGVISDSDRGLALALAGDPAGAVGLLMQAARGPGASAKTRQNLALSLALASQWGMAKVVAEADLSPAEIDARMAQWAAFAQPRAASDQVAALLGVQAIADDARPPALALNAPAPANVAAVAVSPPMVVPTVAGPAKVVFGPPREIVQALPAPTIRTAKVALTAKLRTPQETNRVVMTPARGDYFVQLGAFDSPAVARDAWGRATRRLAAFGGRTPMGAGYSSGGRAFYRLSVGGFTYADAVTTCRRYKAKGGDCFVRAGTGDRMAQWLRRPTGRLAAR